MQMTIYKAAKDRRYCNYGGKQHLVDDSIDTNSVHLDLGANIFYPCFYTLPNNIREKPHAV